MEGFDLTFNRGRKPTFDQAPPSHRRRLFGQDYIHLHGLQGGDLFVTRCGWPLAESLLPSQWFVGQRFCKVGRALAGASGAVYRVPVPHRRCPQLSIVVKFSRFAQDTSVTVADPELLMDEALKQRVADAQFLCPFEEFANVMQLRCGDGLPVHTSQPLAVYSPPTRYSRWELGRSKTLFARDRRRLQNSQTAATPDGLYTYDPERMYILLYRWAPGVDLEQALDQGLISEDEMRQLTRNVRQTIQNKGWLVLDHKPKHVIVRVHRDRAQLRRRAGQPLWAIVDYELLVPRESLHRGGFATLRQT